MADAGPSPVQPGLPDAFTADQQFLQAWMARAAPELAWTARFAALLRAFDARQLSALRGDERGTIESIAQLQQDGLVVEVDRNEYQFESTLRLAYLALWQGDDPDSYHFENGRAAEYYEALAPESEAGQIEYLYHLLAADETQGWPAYAAFLDQLWGSRRLGLFERLLELAGEHAPVLSADTLAWLRLYRAQLDLGLNRPGEAERALQKLLAASAPPQLRASALVSLANLWQARGDTGQVVRYLDEALDIYWDLADHFNAARTLQGQGYAFLLLSSSLGDLHREADELELASRAWFYRLVFAPFLIYLWLSRRLDFLPNLYYGNDYQNWIIYRLLQAALQRFEQAAEELGKVPEDAGLPVAELLADVQIVRADLLHRVERWSEARRLFGDLIVAPPVTGNAYRRATLQMARGRAALNESAPGDARSLLREAGPVFAYYNDQRSLATTTRLLGNADLASGNVDEAIDSYVESVEASLAADDLLASTHIWATLRKLRQRRSLTDETQAKVEALSARLEQRAYIIRFRGGLLLRFQKLATRLAAYVVLPLVYLTISFTLIPFIRPGVIAVVTRLVCLVVPGCQSLFGDLVGSLIAILATVLLAIWAYGLLYNAIGWLTIKGLSLADVAQLRTEYVVTARNGLSLRDEQGNLTELPWEEVALFVSADRRLIRTPTPLLSRQILMTDGRKLVIDGVARHYGSLRHDITLRIEKAASATKRVNLDYTFLSRGWTALILLLALALTAVALADVLDFSDCRRPNIVSITLPEQNRLYVTLDNGQLQIIDVQPRPIAIDLANQLQMPGQVSGLYVQDDFAYVAAGEAGLRVVDVSDVDSLKEIASIDTPGQATAVIVANDWAYVADGPAGIRVLEIGADGTLIDVGHLETPGRATGLALSGDSLYVADEASGLRIIDVSDPARPVELGSFDTPGEAIAVAKEGRFVYVADGTAGLLVLDVADPTAPAVVAEYPSPGQAYDVTVAGPIAYVAAAGEGLNLVFLARPEAEPLSITTEGEATQVALLLDLALVSVDGQDLLAVDVLSPCTTDFSQAERLRLALGAGIVDLATAPAISRPIASASSEFFFWVLILLPIVSIARLLRNRSQLRRIDRMLVAGRDWPLWLGLSFFVFLGLFHLLTLML